jgi:hypothetical protein
MTGGTDIVSTIQECNGFTKWKKTYDWNVISEDDVLTATGTEIDQTWTRTDIYNNVFHIHGKINQYRYRAEGISACTMMSLYAGYKMLNSSNLEESVNTSFIDDCINTGRKLYNNFLETSRGISLMSTDNQTPHTSIDEIVPFFKSFYDIDEVDTSINMFMGLPNIENYNNYFSDQTKNHVCIITVPPETYCLFFDKQNNKVYLFDSHGRGNKFFDIPSSEIQQVFVNIKGGETINHSNSNAFIVKSDNYEEIKKIIQNIGIPHAGESQTMYISLKSS